MSPELIVIGASAGGIVVIKELLSRLERDFSIPIVIVQHISGNSLDSLSSFFKDYCLLDVREVEDKESIENGCVYIAPPNYHVMISKNKKFCLSVDEHVSFSRPSVDVLFETAAEAYGKNLLGVIFTGSNSDGAKGVQLIEAKGGRVWVQSPGDAEYATMPVKALENVKNPEYVGSHGELIELLSGL